MNNWIKFFEDGSCLDSNNEICPCGCGDQPKSWSQTRLDGIKGVLVKTVDNIQLTLYCGIGKYHYAVECDSSSLTGKTEIIAYFLQFELTSDKWLTQRYDTIIKQVTTCILDGKV